MEDLSLIFASSPLTESIELIDGDGNSLRDVSAGRIFQGLQEYGVVILRNFMGEPSAAREVTEGLGQIVKNVEVTGTEYVGYHGELCYTPFPPDLLCFYCLSVSDEGGGETVFCDGTIAVDNFSTALLRLLENHRLCMRSSWSTVFLRRRLEASSDDDLRAKLSAIQDLGWEEESTENRITLTYFTSPIIRTRFQARRAFVNSIVIACHDQRPRPERAYTLTLDNGQDFPVSALEEIVEVTNRLTYAHRWQRRDYVVVDNSRMLHGRNACHQVNTDRRLTNMHTLLSRDRNGCGS